MDLDEIREHWEDSGREFALDGKITPTTRDPFLGQLERENFLDLLDASQNCLEIGCGDASHSMYYARKVASLTGVDVANTLIDVANRRAREESIDNVQFEVGSVLDIENIARGKSFDCVVSQRCLINLPSWEHQMEAIQQVHRLLPLGGTFLLTEGFQEHMEVLNDAREASSLSRIKVVDYNRNFLLEEFKPFIETLFDVVETRHYGAYLFFSRVYHPLVVAPEAPRHDARMNEVAMELQNRVSLPEMEKYSYGLFYSLKKK